MFTSFLIPSVFEGVRARHLCVFYKQLAAFGRGQMNFVGESAYFDEPTTLASAGRPEWQSTWRTTYDYEPPTDLAGVSRYALPDDLLAPRLRRIDSSWKLYGQLVTRRLPELEAAFATALDSRAMSGRVDGVLLFANNPSVSHVAALRGIPVVHNEFGPLRPPDYVMTAYWDRGGVSHHSEAARRYRAFRRAAAAARVPMLGRDEILQVLRRSPVPDAPPPEDAPFRVGVALQGDDNAYVHGTSGLDLLSMARQQHSAAEILVRYHAGSMAHYVDGLGVRDSSPSATAFIQRCESVITVSSGAAFEALLLGRRAVVVGDSPFAIAADRRFEPSTARGEAERLRALNFLAFGYLVPGALMFDPGYVRWRLSGPSELDIYRHHQRWYRAQLLATTPLDASPAALAAAAKLLDALPNGAAPTPAVVFGAGAATSDVIAHLRPERFTVRAVFDNDAAKWGRRLAGVPIEPPTFRADASVVVSSLNHADAIVGQLRDLGYAAERILRLR